MDNILEQDFQYILDKNLPYYKLKNKTIIITGISGFIASYLAKTLLYLNDNLNLNINIVGVVRNKKRAEQRFGNLLKRKDFKLIIQDVSLPLSIKADIIIHAASISSPKFFKLYPVDTLSPNVIGTYNMLKLAQKNNAELLFISTGGVYGETIGLTNETSFGYLDPLDLRSCYHEAKRMGETMCIAWVNQFKLTAKIVRLFHVYGPSMSINDGRAIADFIKDIIKKHEIVIKSDGATIRSFCYLADTVFGILTVLLKGKNGQAYNISNDKSRKSIGEIAQLIVDLYPSLNILIKYIIRNKNDNYLTSRVLDNNPDVSKLRHLGWHPSFSLEKGFKRTIDSFLYK
jgi:nucleoside-diphosphate-sugar epimerase